MSDAGPVVSFTFGLITPANDKLLARGHELAPDESRALRATREH